MSSPYLTLYKFGPQWGLSDPSPFVIKLEAYLRWAGISYESENFTPKSMKAAPKDKIPYVIFADGTSMGDSNLIIDELIARGNKDLDADLTIEQKAISLSFRRMLDENLYWVGLLSRWREPAGWDYIVNTFFKSVPALLRSFVAGRVQKSTLRNAYGHGMGRHARDEMYKIAEKDLDALSHYLGDKTYFFGGKNPTLLDICVYAYIANFIYPDIPSPAADYAREKRNLVAHCERMNKKFNELE